MNLIYIDPPFDTGADFSFTATVPDDPETPEDESFSFTKQPSIIEQKAYRDTWGRGLDSYLQWFYETVVVLHELLHETGSLYVHLDYHVAHYAKLVLDELFGPDRFVNEVVWKRTTAHSSGTCYGPVHDVLYFYSKSDDPVWNPPRTAYEKEYLDKYYRYDDGDGRLYWRDNLTAAQVRHGETGKPWRGFDPNIMGRHWIVTVSQLDKWDAEGRIYWPKEGGMPKYKRYRDELKGKVATDIWDDVRSLGGLGAIATERLDYPTQKPAALLDRIIKASSNEGDLILDCFVGSGTTAAVAEKLNRRWIACDLGRFAIHTTRKRLLSIPDVRPFVVQNLGKYERQLWQTGEFSASSAESAFKKPKAEYAESAEKTQRNYVQFILELYHASPINGYTWLHGVKSGRMVHVGSVDSPVMPGDIKMMAAEFKKAIGTGKGAPTTNGVDVLCWDLAFEANEIAKQQAEAANITLRFLRIPRDVMDKRAVAQGDVKFFELAALSVEVKTKNQDVALKLTDFVIPPDDVPEEVRGAIKHWSQWIDYWAVDWDNKGDAFHNQWQSFRTRKNNKMDLSTAHSYAEPGEYRIVVKVIDILGNDTTKTVKVRVR